MTSRLKRFVVNGNDALEFKLVRSIEDIDDDEVAFKPEMCHQVFGDSETIFGYKDLRIRLYYTAGALETYLGLEYTQKIDAEECDGVKADDIAGKLKPYLSPDIRNMDSFRWALRKEDAFRPYGRLIHSFSINVDGVARQFEVYSADMSYKGFREYHARLQTFVLWYIDAANFIDVDDDQWHYFSMFEKYTGESGKTCYATVGFATVYQYYAYPRNTRPRIAQILVLPPYQRLGLGSHLLRAIYREYLGRNEVKDITVEDPSAAFQRLRDYVDAANCATLDSFSRESLMRGFDKNMAIEARDKFKINKKQARRVYEILRLRATDLGNDRDYREYRLDVKRRLNIPYKREQNDLRKLESALKQLDQCSGVTLPSAEQRMQTLDKEYRALEEEYRKVVKRLEEDCEQ